MTHIPGLIWTVPILRTSSADCNDFNLRILIGDSSVEYCVIGSLIRLIISRDALSRFQLAQIHDQSDPGIFEKENEPELELGSDFKLFETRYWLIISPVVSII